MASQSIAVKAAIGASVVNPTERQVPWQRRREARPPLLRQPNVLAKNCCDPAWTKNCGLIPWNATAHCEISKTSWHTGKLFCERRFGEPVKGPMIPFGAMAEYYPTSSRGQARLHQFGKKILPGIFMGCALIAGGIWKGDILILEIFDASEVYPEDSMRKKKF